VTVDEWMVQAIISVGHLLVAVAAMMPLVRAIRRLR